MPLTIETFITLVVSVIPFCHQIPLLSTLYSCLSDRKSFSENPFLSSYQLYRYLYFISPSALKLFSYLSLIIICFLSKALQFFLILCVDTTFIRRNEIKLPFVKKGYDPLQKRGLFGQVLAIACCHIGKLCFPVGFVIVEGSRTEGVLSLLSSLSFLPYRLTLLVDGGLMGKKLVEWVRREREGWTVIGLIRRNMKVSYRGKEGRVEELVKKARVVLVKSWGIKVICVPFKRRNGKEYYLACTNTKLPYRKVLGRYMKRVGIEVVIRVLKQEMGIGRRIVRKGESLKGWVALCLVGYLLCMGREGRYRERRNNVRVELERYLCNPDYLEKLPKLKDSPDFLTCAKL